MDGIEETCECGHMLVAHPNRGKCMGRFLLPSADKVHVFEMPKTDGPVEERYEACRCLSFSPTERVHAAATCVT